LFLRFLLGTLFVWAVLWATRHRLVYDARMLRMSAIATLFWYLGYVLQTVGLNYTTASNSAFITVLYVVFVPLFLRRFHWKTWTSAGLAMVGVWCLADPSLVLNWGDVLSLGCAAAFAAHMVVLESYTRSGDPVSLTAWQFLLITAALLPTMMFEGPSISAFVPTPTLLLALTITGLLATLAFGIQIWAQRLLPAQRIALIFAVEPACAAWLAWYFLGEQLPAKGWVGSGLILAAVVWGTLSEPSHTTPAEAR
jgi:drug/metabolite transporter (DMT)-like permease